MVPSATGSPRLAHVDPATLAELDELDAISRQARAELSALDAQMAQYK